MRKTRLLRTTVIALAVLTAAFGMTACGKKNKVTENTTTTTDNVSEADKNNEKKPTKVVFDYTDADGVTTKLEGNATVSDNGEAVIEVIDNNGNKAVFTGKASTDNGKLSVSDIKVKDASTLVKTDGTEIKVTEDAKIEDATESTEETKADIAAKEESKEDTIVADGGNTDSGNTDAGAGNENAGDNGADSGNVSGTPGNEPIETPDVPSEPDYVPDVPSEPTPEPEPEPTPEPQPEEPAPAEPEIITTVNPFDGKTYRYVEPEDMDYKIGLAHESEIVAINGNRDTEWDYSCEFKTLTTRTFYQVDGTYTVYEGWYSMSGDFTATPKQIASQLGIDWHKAFGAYTIVGWFIDEEGDYTEVAFTYLRP